MTDTMVVIVGAGVAGMTAANLLRRCGVSCVVLERQSREHVERRQRAGVLEYRAARMFEQWKLSEVLGEFPADSTLEIRVNGASQLILRDELSRQFPGRLIPQQVLLRNLISAFLGANGDLRFEAAAVALDRLETDQPRVTYVDPAGNRREIACSFVAGCDGDHGVCGLCVPPAAMAPYTFDYGIVWLTVLAAAPPPRYPLMAVSDHGFAGHFARGPAASRFYLQCAPDERAADWPDARIWAELRARLGDNDLSPGDITDRETFVLRAAVHEPMSHHRLFLLGDAAHIIAPIGGKGMNLALYDAEVFACAVRDYARDGNDAGLRAYSDTCLRRVWRYQEFARSLTEMVHDPNDLRRVSPFQARLASARLDRLLHSDTAERDFAELFAGLA